MGTWFLLDEDTPQSSRSWRWRFLLRCFSHLFPDYQLLPRVLGPGWPSASFPDTVPMSQLRWSSPQPWELWELPFRYGARNGHREAELRAWTHS